MTTGRKIFLIIGGATIIGGSIYLIYRKKKGDVEVEALANYIDSKTYTEVDISKGGDEAIKNILNTKVDPNRLRVDSSYGKYADPKIKSAIPNIVTELSAAIKGAGTDSTAFMKAFSRIKNKNTMAFVNSIYKVLNGQGLFEAMKQEAALHNSQYGQFNDNKTVLSTIPLINSYWNPSISKYLQFLPEYT